MPKVEVKRKCSFKGIDPVVYDEKGIFYEKEGEAVFNLPPGIYEVENAEYNGCPIRYRCPSLPFPEKLGFLPSDKKLRVIVASEVEGRPISKAAIDTYTNKLFLNPSLGDELTPAFLCTVAHELGHYFYDTEELCDQYAMFTLIKHGLNPSQFRAYTELLTDYSNDRKIAAITYAEKIHETSSLSCLGLFGL